MQRADGRPGISGSAAGASRPRLAARAVKAARAAAAACVLAAGSAALAGCAQKASAAASIQVAAAYVQVPASGDTTEAYLVIRNNGQADRLTAVRTSVGGLVTFRAPTGPGASVMKTVPDIAVPADSIVRLTPDSPHLLITGAGRMRSGGQITLTLVFAKGGTMSVAADVTNPESGGSSYFLN